MKILILGSGILGVGTAYELGRRGFEVTVLDRQPESAAECSYANGGQLSYHSAEPWATQALLRKLPGWIFRSDSPLVFKPRADWQMIRWGLMFLRNCTPARTRANCVNLLRLGLYSKERLAETLSQTQIQFDYSADGILHIYSDEAQLEAGKRQAEFQAKFGGEERFLSGEECLRLEPALAGGSRHILGGVHALHDETGDAYLYCQALARLAAERYGVRFEYGETITGLRTENGSVTAVSTSAGERKADAYVMALGAYSPLYLRLLGINLPIYPMKGYSLTLPASENCPSTKITDVTHKIVYSRLGERLRVAGTAEFAGYDTGINDKRIRGILKWSRQLFPRIDWDQEMGRWACLRPSTPDGPPVLGHTPYPNLFLNTGHGTLGWTQAAGSAAIVADLIEGKRPAIMLHGLTMERYL